MPVTIKDIAREAGVSVATVSKVLRDDPDRYIGAATRERVRQVARQHRYRQNVYAQKLRLGRSHLVGLMAFDTNIRVNALKLQAAERAVRERGFRTAIWNAAGQADLETQALDECQSHMADGLLIIHPSADLPAERVAPLVAAGTPIVTFSPIEGLAVDLVTIDRRHGARLAVEHLLGLGHRRIGFLQGDQRHHTDRQRTEGYREAFAWAGLPVDDSLFVLTAGGYQGGYDSAHELLRRDLGPTAVFCNNDEMAIGAMRAFREAGQRVPEDLAVVGFDDVEAAAFAPVPLTTVSQPVEEQARRAVELLFRRIDAPDSPAAPEAIVLQPRLVVRESCGSAQGRTGIIHPHPNEPGRQ